MKPNKRESSSTDKHIGMRLRARRLELAMSQTQLAQAIGLTFQQVQKYEKGANRIGGSRMHQLAMALKVTVAYFFEGLEEAAKPTRQGEAARSRMEFLTTSTGQRIAAAFPKLPDGVGPILADLIERLAA